MNCDEVQERLSEYLEQALDEGNLRSVESHLSSCRLCRAEADSLALCIESIANLPAVEPPIGFAQRVMSHVRELEAKPSLWQRFWLPLGSKIPIHATAAVLIGILTLYLFEKEDPQKNFLPQSAQVAPDAPSREEQLQTPAPEPSSSTAGIKQPEGPSSLPESHGQSTATKRTAAQTQKSRDRKQPRASSTANKDTVGAGSLQEPQGTTSTQPLIPVDPRRRPGGVISGTPIVNPATPRIGAGPFSLPSELEAESFRVPSSSSFARLADYELVVRRRPGQQDSIPGDDPRRLQSNLDRLMAMIPDSARPHIVWVSLAPSQLDQFKRDLLSMGTIESESATSYRDLEFASKTGSEMLIRLTILPAIEANRTNPTHRAIR